MFIRVWETLRDLILYKYPFKGLPKEVEEEKYRWDIYGFQELNNRSLSVHTQAAKGEGASTPISLSCQRTRAVSHKLEARHLDGSDPQTTRKSKG